MIDGLDEIEDCAPILYKDLPPTWWRDIPSGAGTNMRTAKNCPSFSDMFLTGYVIRMWCDLRLNFNDNSFRWQASHPFFKVEHHQDAQFMNYAPKNLRDSSKGVLKFVSPWILKTSRGCSTYQMPMTYDFNDDFFVLPGIIHTDEYHVTNLQVVVTSKKEEFVIKRGTPLAIHFPYRRSKNELVVHGKNDGSGAESLDIKSSLISNTKFLNSYRSLTGKVYD